MAVNFYSFAKTDPLQIHVLCRLPQYSQGKSKNNKVLLRPRTSLRHLRGSKLIALINLQVQQAIGAYVNFSESNGAVGDSFANTGDDDRTQGSVEDCRRLIDQGVYLVQVSRPIPPSRYPKTTSFPFRPPNTTAKLTLPFKFNGDADYVCNWIGNEAVIDTLIQPPGYSTAGYANFTLPASSSEADEPHGAVKQSANFAFARIYEAGHEVPFYQPAVALALFNRSIHGVDIATGETAVRKGCGDRTQGPARSEYREGNGTVQFSVVPGNSTYNTETDEPDPPINGTGTGGGDGKKRVKRSSEVERVLSRRGAFVPPGGRKMARKMGMMEWPRW